MGIRLGSALTLFSLGSSPAFALPTAMLLSGTGNQRDITWQTAESRRFRVYHDEKAQALGKYAAVSLETAWPYLSSVFQVRLPGDSPLPGEEAQTSRFDSIPVVVSTRADVGGFANLATQNIELQIASGGPASLFQHELAHRIMYERLDPMLGPAGRAFTIAMLPTWWIEGVAEYLTESTGRQETLGISRTLSLNGLYPTWDSLHNLYSNHGDYGRGYTTSGRFVRFVLGKSKEKSIAAIHDNYFWKTMIPPFMTASNFFIRSIAGASGEDLYDEFKQDEAHYWRETLAGMPSLKAGQSAKSHLRLGWTPNPVLIEDKIVTSQLTAEPFESSFLIADTKSGQISRVPTSLVGSGSLEPDLTRSAFWTSRGRDYSNGASGSIPVYATYEGSLTSPIRIVEKVIPIGSGSAPHQVMQFASLGEGRSLMITNTRGDHSLWLVDAKTGTAIEKRKWDAPKVVRFLPARTRGKPAPRNCATVMIDSDLEVTSLEKVCADGQTTQVLAPRRLYFRHGIEESDGTFTLLGAWGECQGIVSLSGGEVRGLFPVPEWVDRLTPWSQGQLGAWTFNGDGYDLVSFSLEEAQTNYRSWIRNLPQDSRWQRLPAWAPYEPPFVRVAKEQREFLKRKEAVFSGTNQLSATIIEGEKQEKITIRKGGAPYRHHHFFTYPTVVPAYFGGWSLGLASVPFIDEMERHQLQIMGQYNFTTGSPSLNVSYVNQRFLDAFTLTGFTRERFNGFYYWTRVGERGSPYRISPYPVTGHLNAEQTSYLRENGVEASTRLEVRPTSLSLKLGARLSSVAPDNPNAPIDRYTYLRSGLIGPEFGLLGSASAGLSFRLFEVAAYMAPAQSPLGSHLRWNSEFSLTGETTHSLDTPRDYLGTLESRLNFQRFQARLTNTFAYEGHTLTVRGAATGTTGPHTLLLREYYQPYQTYLLGSGMGLNQLNYELMSQGNLFGRLLGTYSFRTSADWSFPIVKSIDKQILIFYFDNLRGEAVIGHGGVARTEDFKDIHRRTSASFAARATIDIKGFQLYPSLAYGRLLDASGWSIFSELAFSEFF